MFRVICTGKNLNYGKKGQIRLLCDNYVIPALTGGWITYDIKYVGNGNERGFKHKGHPALNDEIVDS